MNQEIYKVEGMHCHSCEILIKEGISKLPGIKYVEVSEHRGDVLIEGDEEIPNIEKLKDIFKEEKFIFSVKELQSSESVVVNAVVETEVKNTEKVATGDFQIKNTNIKRACL